MFEEGIKNFWGTVDREAFFKSAVLLFDLEGCIEKKIWCCLAKMLVASGWRIGSPFPVHCSQSLCAASMGYVLVLKQAQVCLAVILPQSFSQVITFRPSWGSVLLFSLPKISVKSFCLDQSLLSCCKFRLYNYWCFAGLFQLMSRFSWEFFAALAVFFSFSHWLIDRKSVV